MVKKNLLIDVINIINKNVIFRNTYLRYEKMHIF